MNISISEIAVILIIALLVVKPEQMPEVAVTFGRFIKSIRRLFTKAQAEMNELLESVETHESKSKQE